MSGRVVLASTVWVYGAVADPGRPGRVDPRPTRLPPRSPRPRRSRSPPQGHVYTSTKIAAELLMHSYQQTYGLPFTILRYGVPYGPGMRDELVLARFVRRACLGEPLSVAGDGRQVRNYVYVRDLADAHVLALDQAAQNATLALDGQRADQRARDGRSRSRPFPRNQDRTRPVASQRLPRPNGVESARRRPAGMATDDGVPRRGPPVRRLVPRQSHTAVGTGRPRPRGRNSPGRNLCRQPDCPKLENSTLGASKLENSKLGGPKLDTGSWAA